MSDFYNERHARKGIVTNQPDGYDKSRPHASTQVCDRDACIKKATFWVQGVTGESAVLVLDADRKPWPADGVGHPVQRDIILPPTEKKK